MRPKVNFLDFNLIDFKKAWNYQEKLFDEIIKLKAENGKNTGIEQTQTRSHLIFCEHPHVYTLGKNGLEKNLLMNQLQLREKNVRFYRINRGGDITYHGPGQLVAYPIFDLDVFNMHNKQYIFKLEQSIIKTLKEYNIFGERLAGATGVWLDTSDQAKARKICAIGVRVSRFVTMHGFALNVNTDLEYFNYIHPCGFMDKGVTSMEKEFGEKVDIGKVKEKLKYHLAGVFEMKLEF